MQDAALLSSTLVPLTVAHLDALLAIEMQAHSHPWTRGNVIDALAAGYYAQGLWSAAVPGGLWGYCIAMPGASEAHLLNITVAPAHQGQGGARRLLQALDTWARSQQARELWLEVRASNTRALALYRRLGLGRAQQVSGRIADRHRRAIGHALQLGAQGAQRRISP